MKKSALSLLSLLFVVTSSFAQFHVRASVGYNLPAASEQIGMSQDARYDNNGYTYKQSGVYGSFGSGVAAHLAVGGSLKNGILGYDIDFGYVKGRSYKVENNFDNNGNVSTNTETYEGTSIQISPALTFTTGTGSFQPFARIGPTFGISSVTMKDESFDPWYEYTATEEYEFKGGLNIGFKGVIGCSYQITEHFQVYVEADFVSLAYGPKKRTWTRYEENGVDNLPNVDPKYIELEFEDERTLEDVYEESRIRPRFAMSSFGLQGGVKFIF